MKYGFYNIAPMEVDYSSYFKPDTLIEFHLKAVKEHPHEILYLARKHKKIRGSEVARANIDKDVFTVQESYSDNELIYYFGVNEHFLWLKEKEVNFFISNSQAKHVLEKVED